MTNPVNPNFKPGVGRLATDRYDFAAHVDGAAFNHLAGQIVLSPAVTIGVTAISDVQTAIAALAGNIIVPTVPLATLSTPGTIRLGGDLGAITSTGNNPILGSLQGTALSITAPSMNQVLQWNGAAWVNAAIVPATTSSLGTIQLSAAVSGSSGDIGNTATVPRVIGLQGFPVASTVPSNGSILVFSGGSWAPGSGAAVPSATVGTTTGNLGVVTLGGDFSGNGSTALVPRTSGINGATVPAAGALTTGHVLQVSGAAVLSYGFIADANVSATAAIAGTKVSPAFGSQNLSTTGTAALGATTITGALVAGANAAVNTLTGSSSVTTRTITASLTVDTTTTDYVIFCRTLSAAITVTLPVPTNGRRLIVKDIEGNAATNNITLAPHSTDKIEGLNVNKVLANSWGSWTLVSNGTDWFLV
jgi:hypothetical protein